MNKRIAKKIIKRWHSPSHRYCGRYNKYLKAVSIYPDIDSKTKNDLLKVREDEAKLLGITQGVFPGDIVETNDYGTKSFGYIKGRVTDVNIGINIEDHGYIFFDTIDMDKVRWRWLEAGQEESFVHYEWTKYLQIVKDDGI